MTWAGAPLRDELCVALSEGLCSLLPTATTLTKRAETTREGSCKRTLTRLMYSLRDHIWRARAMTRTSLSVSLALTSQPHGCRRRISAYLWTLEPYGAYRRSLFAIGDGPLFSHNHLQFFSILAVTGLNAAWCKPFLRRLATCAGAGRNVVPSPTHQPASSHTTFPPPAMFYTVLTMPCLTGLSNLIPGALQFLAACCHAAHSRSLDLNWTAA